MRFILPLLLCANAAHANTCGRATLVGVGDTFSVIAQRCGVPVEQVLANNEGVDPTDLSIGHIVALDNTGNGRDVYEAWFLGAYSPSDICMGQEVQVDLTADTVTFFETRCTIKGVVFDSATAVYVNLTACDAEGEKQPDRFINLSWSGEVMTYDGAAGIDLRRCTDR